MHKKVEKAIDDTGSVQQRRHGPVCGTLAKPGFECIAVYLRGGTLTPNHDFLEAAKCLTIIDWTYRAAQPQLA